MFDMGFTEVVLIGVVALVGIGPERLPGVAITVGKYVGKMKRFMTNVRADVESELKTDEIRKLLAAQQEELSSLKDVVSEGFDMSDVAKSIDDSMSSVLGNSTASSPLETSSSSIVEADLDQDQKDFLASLDELPEESSEEKSTPEPASEPAPEPALSESASEQNKSKS